MGLALLDRFTPWRRNRVKDFLSGAGEPHIYMVHVAIGWVVARVPGKIENVIEQLDPQRNRFSRCLPQRLNQPNLVGSVSIKQRAFSASTCGGTRMKWWGGWCGIWSIDESAQNGKKEIQHRHGFITQVALDLLQC